MSVPPRARSGSGPERTQQSFQHAVFMQNKLEGIYKETYQFLAPRKDWVEEAENVLVWNKPLVSACLYLALHWVFIMFAQSDSSLMSLLGSLLVWCALADILWRAATNQFNSGGKKGGGIGIVQRLQSSVQPKKKKLMSFESVMMLRCTQLKSKELPSLEVLSLWIAEDLMWLDNLCTALMHWSVNEPYLFGVCIFFPGLGLSLIGKYIPTIALLYILVIGVLVWPYIAYHDLWNQLILYVTARYPQALHTAKTTWLNFKAFVSKDNTKFVEISLDSGAGGDGSAPAETFQDPLEPASGRSDNMPRPPPRETHGRSDMPRLPHVDTPMPRPPPWELDAGRAADPGMSILQDSVLGLRPDAFLLNDSLSLGPGDMPSLTDLDQSLSLPQFPSGLGMGREAAAAASSDLEQSLSLPQFPSLTAGVVGSSRQSLPGLSAMPSITEEDDVAPPSRSVSLDPFTDSFEAEFGGYDFTDSRPHPQSTRLQRPLIPLPPMHQIPEEPEPARLTGLETVYLDDQASRTDGGGGYPGGYVPPPSYQSAVDGSDGGMSNGSGQNEGSEEGTGDVTKGGYYLRQRR